MIELFNDCEAEFIVVDEAFKPIIEATKGKVGSARCELRTAVP
jgi:hypothetical protein